MYLIIATKKVKMLSKLCYLNKKFDLIAFGKNVKSLWLLFFELQLYKQCMLHFTQNIINIMINFIDEFPLIDISK